MADVLMGQEKSGIFAAVPACGEPTYARVLYIGVVGGRMVGEGGGEGDAGLAICPRRVCRAAEDDGEAGCCLRRDAIHRVSHRLDGHTAGKNVVAGPCPERVRRDESRLYVADCPCGGE